MAACDSLILAENDVPWSRVTPNRLDQRSALSPELEGHLAGAAQGPGAAIETLLLSSEYPESRAAMSRATRPANRQGR